MPHATAVPPPRNLQQTLGRTVLDEDGLAYRFESFVLDGPEPGQRWRVRLGIPRCDLPVQGLPSLWMLDGNAALMEFDRAVLQELASRSAPPVLVFIGYDNELRVDAAARTRDYTFVADTRQEGEQGPQCVGGGAAVFLQAIEQGIAACVRTRVALDPAARSLWGHSLGGLFVLSALYAEPNAFQAYAAASPSLWWANGAVLGEPEQRFVSAAAFRHARLLVTLGGGERARDLGGRDLSDPRVLAHLQRINAVPSDAAPRLASRLQRLPGLDVHYREFPGLGHGPALRASLLYALHWLYDIVDRSDTPRSDPP